MTSIDQLQAFVSSAELGSFSAASRHLQKAQSAVSTAIINLEIDIGYELFDRSARQPTLTSEGQALLFSARHALKSHQEFNDHTASIGKGIESKLCIAIEQGIFVPTLLEIFNELSQLFPFVEIELLDPGTNDVARLLQQGRADMGLMFEQEDYPHGFYFRGIGHSKLIPVCSQSHPLADKTLVNHADLRQHLQLLCRSRSIDDTSHQREQKSAKLWYGESPYMIMSLLVSGLGWALLPHTVVSEKLNCGELIRLNYDFQQSDILQGVDVVWTKKKPLGPCGQWLLEKLFNLEPELWKQ